MHLSTLFHALRSTRLLRLSCLFAALATGTYAQPATKLRLPAAAHGSAAISALGRHLPDVAKAYGLQAQELVTLFQTQPSLGVDTEGALLFACNGLPATLHGAAASGNRKSIIDSTADALTADSSVNALASGISVDAFKLHSLPGVSRVIYLDFTGHTTSGTSWNSAYASGAPIVSQPFNLDADPLTFNATERSVIQKIWQRVAEDYAPFNVDVTTEDPGAEGLRRSDSSDPAYGIRIVISPTNWYKTTAGGVAYIGSFNANTDTPCFAFTAQLGTSSDKYIGECVAHEVGHTLGLYHDGLSGTSPTEYYQGQGTWAPIMGNSYYKTTTQFSKGEYANANSTQDDHTVIATYVPVNDDHGNTLVTASHLTGPAVADGGTIENRGDVDLFRFDSGAGNISLNVTSPSNSTNLDLKVELLNSAGQVLVLSDSLTSLTASITATVAAGTYYLRIDGVGNGDPATTGYSDYASIGNYVISGTIVSTGAQQPPVARISASTTSGSAALTVSFSAANSTDADGTIVSYHWDFGTGATSTSMYPVHTYTNSGVYTANLTAIDNDGMASTASVTINVAPAANQLPIAAAAGNLTSGYAPLPVVFSSAGSFDPDGSIASYSWDFGDGSTATGAAPTKIFSVPGTYTTRLTVTDNRGGIAVATVLISAQRDPNTDIDINQFGLSATTARNGSNATAIVTIRDRLGRPVANAAVSVAWSGIISETSTGKTDGNGRVSITSGRSKKSGVVTAKITSIVPPAGTIYDASIYPEPLVRSTQL